jgi:restriction system protein
MPVPGFQSLMLPLLRIAGDGKEYSLAEAREMLAEEFRLSSVEIEELLPSGRQSKFANRVAWAKSYLQQAGLFATARRGHFQLSERGRDLLRTPPARIDIKFLERYPEFVEFRAPKSETEETSRSVPPGQTEPETPEEALEAAYLKLRVGLAGELLSRVKAATPPFFERLVVELLLKMGYGGSRKDAGQAIGRSGDEGIDGVISEDRLGLDVVYLQAKKWDGTVGRPEIQRFVGALHGKRAKKGVFITTGAFSAEAVAYVDHIDPKVVLIDGRRLAELMMDFDVGVNSVGVYSLKRVDSDYFEDTGAV